MLDDRQAVHYARVERIETSGDPKRYEYRPDIGWRWLQRILFLVLGWIGAYHLTTVTTFVRTPQENDSLLKSLLGQEGQWIRYIHYERRARIYMGPDDFPELIRLCEHMGMSVVDMRGRISTRSGRHEPTWHDIPITVVPWMVGAILVPE